MGAFRVTERSIATSVLANLQGNITRVSDTQNQLSSGKQISRASDDPGGTVTAMQIRSDLAMQRQYSRNATDGLSWLGTADVTLTTISGRINRARDLVLQGLSTGTYSDAESRSALASEIDNIRASVIDLANTRFLDRPIFGGTAPGTFAFDDNGDYVGDDGEVKRTVGDNTKVRVDVSAVAAFGEEDTQLFKVLQDISGGLMEDPEAPPLAETLDRLDAAATALRNAQSSVGARYNQLTDMQLAADNRVVNLAQQLSDVEDIDLPKTITDLTLQQTAYQAALAASAKVVQPSLLDFLR
jgi:flagellar hook-associated protein 3 FlgL